MNEPYVSMLVVGGGMLERIPKDLIGGLARVDLLGLINMPRFRRPTEVNACVKKILVCFHGGFLW